MYFSDFASNVFAKDFGTRGAVFSIIEEPFVKMIERRLGNLDISKHQAEMEARARQQVENPLAIKGITRAQADRECFYDPTFTLERDAVLGNGHVLYKAGVKINPLDHMDFDRRLIFIDGRDNEQNDWLKQMQKLAGIEDLVILVGGKLLALERDLERKLYFDQGGELTSRFGIQYVPAIVIQVGKQLKIMEIRI